MEVIDKYTESRTEKLRTKEEAKLRRVKARDDGRRLREEKLRRAQAGAALKAKRGERDRLVRPAEVGERGQRGAARLPAEGRSSSAAGGSAEYHHHHHHHHHRAAPLHIPAL